MTTTTLPVDALIQPSGLRADTDGLERCPDCARWLRRNRRTHALPYHYNPVNPPIYGAWEGCPGPTPQQKAYAAKYYPGGDPGAGAA
jgi:hypothetical protein